MAISTNELEKITSFPKLVDLLRDKLDWPISDDYGFEDVIYEWEASELGLRAEETAKIREIHQLKPLTTGQPWGIFFLSFEEKKISVSVLRRMLRSLIVKRRQSEQESDRQSWQLHDLIFATNIGLSGERELAIAHFSDAEETGDLPILNVLGWNRQDTRLHNEYVAEMLENRLRWPDDTNNLDNWRTQWSSAFEIGHGEVIRTSKELAQRLAGLAGNIRASANELLAAESEEGRLQKLLEAFRKNLVQDLDEDGFADMFAQTISYGLLAAHISRPSGEPVADDLVDMVAETNPFLRELFGTYLSLGGRDKRKAMDFDELGVRDVVNMLRKAKMEPILRDFGDRNPKEDPVIHFYELFLKEYDPEKRTLRGVFYTPRPVVNFIVRGVDEMLREEFKLPLGLADTTTWGELASRNDAITVPDHIAPEMPFVQILDPATGTGTFLVEVIDLIHMRMVDHWKAGGMHEPEIELAWNDYVPKHLLPRLTGFELMMAPYAIAHMKIGLKLLETGYSFGSDERVRVFLTNALEPARDFDDSFGFIAEALAHEAKSANRSKDEAIFTIVIGNPPYSIQSQNLTEAARKWVDPYRYCDGGKIVERNALQFEKNIQDDYVKFYRLAEYYIQRNGGGCVGLITNHGFLDGATFRGMRQSILNTFSDLYLLDLHGNKNKREIPPDEGEDENVFEISQGVCISLSFKIGKVKLANVLVGDLWGYRERNGRGKYGALLTGNAARYCVETVTPCSPLYLFKELKNQQEFFSWSCASDVLPLYSMGIKTSRDKLVVDFEIEPLLQRIDKFRSADMGDREASEQFGVALKKGWDIGAARGVLREMETLQEKVASFLYRPFDFRQLFYDRSVVFSAAHPIMRNFIETDGNIGLVLTRQTKDQWDVQVTNKLTGHKSLGAYDANSVFPLFLVDVFDSDFVRPNLDTVFAEKFGNYVSLSYNDGNSHDEQTSTSSDIEINVPVAAALVDRSWNGRGDLETNFGPRDLFDWIYAVLHSPGYRARYAEILASNFPRIPMPGDRTIFQQLIPFGTELVALHLLKIGEVPILKNPDVVFRGSGEARIGKGYPMYENGKVMINPDHWFEDVVSETWAFHVGGYQVCQKWLDDRAGKGGKNPTKGRVLTYDDTLHYRRIVTALTETRRLMSEIDTVIDKHGGWPDAFYVPPPPPPTIEEIVRADEGQDLEYKSTFQWSLTEERKDGDVRKASLKTVAAFLNSGGGTLVIGVSDDKKILGLEADLALTRNEKEWFQQTVVNYLTDTIGAEFAPRYEIQFGDAGSGKEVCIIEVKEKGPSPAFLEAGGDSSEFYVRTSNKTAQLTGRAMYDYISAHW